MNIKKIKEKIQEADAGLYGEKNIVDSVAMLYHENSKFNKYSQRLIGENIARFNNPYITARSSQPYKCYPGTKTIDLSLYKDYKPPVDFLDILSNRRSIRTYDSNYKLSINELAFLLFNSYGVNHKMKLLNNVDGHLGLRNVPSAGALYPLEIYVTIFKAHFPAGLYHYRPDKNYLEQIKTGNFVPDLLKIIQADPYVDMASASAVIISTGFIERDIIKYGERGYRFMMQESGFVGQTISLLAEAVNLASCMLGGYHDDELNAFLGVDGTFETVNNIIVVGGKTTVINAKPLEV